MTAMNGTEAELNAMIAELSRATCLELLAGWEWSDTTPGDRLQRSVCMAYKMGWLSGEDIIFAWEDDPRAGSYIE